MSPAAGVSPAVPTPAVPGPVTPARRDPNPGPGLERRLQTVDRLTLLAAAVCAATALASWAIWMENLASGTPLAPGTFTTPGGGLAFALSAACLVLLRDGAQLPWLPQAARKRLEVALPAALLSNALGTWVAFAARMDLSAWMSSGSAFSFTFLGAAFFLRGKYPRVALALVFSFFSLLFVIGLWYLYAVSSVGPLAAFSSTSVASITTLLALTVGMMLLEVPRGVLRVLVADSPAGATARRLLPTAFVGPPLVGYFRLQGELAGIYDSSVGIALFAAALVGIFALLAASTARAIGRVEAQRVLAEEARRKSEDRFRALTEGGADVVTIVGAESRIQYVSPSIRALTGFAPEEIFGKASADLIHPDDRGILVDKLPWLLEHPGVPISAEQRVLHKDGHYVWTEGTIVNRAHDPAVGGLVANFRDITARREAEAALRASEQRLALIYGSVLDPIFLLAVESDAKYRFESVNGRFLAVTGLSIERVIGKTVEEVLPPSSHALVVGKYREAARTKGPVTWEEVAEYPAGKRYGHVAIAPVIDSSGRCTHIIGAVHDVTAIREAESALRESEERFLKAFKASPVAMTMTDFATARFLELNGAAEALLGLSRAEAIGKTSVELGVTRAETQAALRDRVAEQSSVQGVELEITNRRGERLTLLNSVEAVDNPRGRYYLSVFVDITQRKRAEEEVRRAQETLAAAQRIGHVGSWEWDVVQDKSTWSDEMFRIFGLDPAQPAVNYQRALTMMHPEDQERFAADVKAAVEGPAPYYSEYRIVRSDGEVRFLTSQGEVTRDSAGRALRMVGAVHDLTGRKRAELDVIRTREEITVKAAELSRSNAELEQFAYVASHDLQEPLRMISSYLQLIETRYKGKLDADADDFIRYGVDGAKRMQALINDLLSFSRVGTRGAAFQEVDSAKALEAALQNLEVAVEEARANVSHGPLPSVWGDGGQLTQLFQNLVGNAIKFRSATDPDVRIEASRDGPAWAFSVKDNGIGIEPKHFDRIFIVFQRLHGRGDYPGTGIGLAISKKIVERHGGRIWVESEPGKGSAFHFTIPDKQERRGMNT